MKKLFASLLFAFSFAGACAFVSCAPSGNAPQIVYAQDTNAVTADEFKTAFKAFRDKYPNICSPVAKEDFEKLYDLYIQLSDSDKKLVDQTADRDGYTIKDTMKKLVDTFMNKEKTQKIELNKGNTLVIVITLSVFGMSTICGFFLLKNKNVIE